MGENLRYYLEIEEGIDYTILGGQRVQYTYGVGLEKVYQASVVFGLQKDGSVLILKNRFGPTTNLKKVKSA